MSQEVYNKILLKGEAQSLRNLLDSCKGYPVLENGTISTEEDITFNSYIKVDTQEEASEKWGVAVDSLRYYKCSFEKAYEIIESNQEEECSIEISFMTYNGIVFKWVSEMAKANPDVNIRYYVLDRINDFYSSCEFDANSKNVEYKTERYLSVSELEYKFLKYDLKDILNSRIGYAKFRLDTGEDDFEFDLEDAMGYLEEEFKFLSEDKFAKLMDETR